MLILTRKPGEAIVVGPDIKITVLAVIGHQVRIGVEAPRNVQVDREEVHKRKLAEREAFRPTVRPCGCVGVAFCKVCY